MSGTERGQEQVQEAGGWARGEGGHCRRDSPGLTSLLLVRGLLPYLKTSVSIGNSVTNIYSLLWLDSLEVSYCWFWRQTENINLSPNDKVFCHNFATISNVIVLVSCHALRVFIPVFANSKAPNPLHNPSHQVRNYPLKLSNQSRQQCRAISLLSEQRNFSKLHFGINSAGRH